jgi:putative ABC transport system permease protein
MEQAERDWTPELERLALSRYESLKTDAQAEYEDGLQEYQQGLADYEEGKKEAEQEFAKAEKELREGQKEIDDNLALLEDGEAQLQDGKDTLAKSETQLVQSQKELADAKAEAYEQLANAYDELMSNYKTALAGQQELNDGLAQLSSGIDQLQSGLKQIDSGLDQLDLVIGILKTGVGVTQTLIDAEKASPVVNEERIAKLEEELTAQQEKLDGYIAQKEEALTTKTELTAQLLQLQEKQKELEPQKETLDSAIKQIELGIMELESKQIQTENQFASAEAKLESAVIQLEEGKKELATQEAKLAESREELEAAQVTLNEGKAEFEAEKAKAEKELFDAKVKLEDAQAKLEEAKETIASMTDPEVFVLNRNTNPGYLAVDNNSDIVAGVSRVFPAFFLLIAALVCITTLTKMVDEERTQIGVLKAMGYRSGAIMSKYLFYCGSAAVVGCGLGVIVGSIVFPKIFWKAYSLILCLTPKVELQLNVPLCLAVVAAYTAVSLLVTWYCCRRELKEVPAQLIRPKAPTPGKKIFMEYLPFWNKISFLNKVMFRNVFRYRQRLFMMMVGIGGCTALLLTGFGIRDSIVDIVSYQFSEVTVYDMEVYFSDGQTQQQQEAIQQELRGDVDQILFYHRSSVDLDFDNQTKPVDLIATDRDLKDYMHLQKNGKQLKMPQKGEIILSIGTAEAMGIRMGDTVTLRNADLKEISVKVSGVFENHVNNFLIVLPQTLENWGGPLEQQMAIINVRDAQDVHEAGAKLAAMENVMAVSISQDIADQVGGMLKALDLVVLTVVICAGMLAVIVLYNLTNISITERIREIATIKVLGFNSKESAAYVFKENLFLTALGACVGLGGGIALLRFVMSQIKIDMVWFQPRLSFLSYILALVLTMVSACLVDFFLYFKLEKINMAEALKSVE